MTTISGVVSTVTGPEIMMSRLWTVLQGMLLTGEGIHIECLPFHRKMLFSGRGTSQAALCHCWHQGELSYTFSVQYAFHLER